MGKPIQQSIFKSRLTITYRTNISGTPTQESLPYRLLVLGEFSGAAVRPDAKSGGTVSLLPDLASREIKSIKRGTTVNDHLKESVPVYRMSTTDPAFKALRSRIPGHVSGALEQGANVVCNVPRGAIARNEGGAFPLSGKVRFSSKISENGLCDFEGDLRVGGELTLSISDKRVKVETAKVKVSGALLGHYKDPATGKIAGIVTAFMESVPLELSATAVRFNELDDPGDATGQLSATKPFQVEFDPVVAAAERTLPFASIDAFSPDSIAAAIPELHRLQVIKQLLTDLQSALRNRPELRKLVKTMLPPYNADQATREQKLAPFVALKSWAAGAYPLLQVEAQATPTVTGNAAS